MLASASQGSFAVWAAAAGAPLSPTNLFAPVSTPAQSIHELALFILAVAAAIFLVVFSLLLYAVVRFRGRPRTIRASLLKFTEASRLSWPGPSSRC